MDVKWKDCSSAVPCEPHHVASMLETLSKQGEDGTPTYVVSGDTIMVRHGDHIFEATLRRTGLIEAVKQKFHVFYQLSPEWSETFVVIEAVDEDDAWDLGRKFARLQSPEARVNSIEKV